VDFDNWLRSALASLLLNRAQKKVPRWNAIPANADCGTAHTTHPSCNSASPQEGHCPHDLMNLVRFVRFSIGAPVTMPRCADTSYMHSPRVPTDGTVL